jgi:hypothetical protein
MAPATAAAQPPAPCAHGMPAAADHGPGPSPPSVHPCARALRHPASPGHGPVLRPGRPSQSAPRPTDRTDLARPGAADAPLPQCGSFDPNSRFAVRTSWPRPRTGRGGDRLRQRRLQSTCEQALTELCQPSGARWPCRDLAGVVRPVPRHRPAAQVRERWRWSTPPVRTVVAAVVLAAALVADAAADERPDTRGVKGGIGWVSPAVLDVEAVGRLRSSTLQLPLPWVLDWRRWKRSTPKRRRSCTCCSAVGTAADRHALDRRRPAAAGAAGRRAHRRARCRPGFWMLRLERCAWPTGPTSSTRRPSTTASPTRCRRRPGKRARCQVRGASGRPIPPHANDVHRQRGASSFLESSLVDETAAQECGASVELSGQLVGRHRPSSCSKLTASWAPPRWCRCPAEADPGGLHRRRRPAELGAAKRSENRSVTFVDAHRLVALFFGAMGINEHARVRSAATDVSPQLWWRGLNGPPSSPPLQGALALTCQPFAGRRQSTGLSLSPLSPKGAGPWNPSTAPPSR